MMETIVTASKIIGNRLDVSFYKERFDFYSKTYSSFPISDILLVNPNVKYEGLNEGDEISFVPMETIDEKNGVISEKRKTTVSNTKGFTKFKENDLLWAKITPCMQNGKSAIARNLTNGYGCGSTEFYVLRPKSDNILIEYVHIILRDKRVLESAKNSFGGSAGQQRVSSNYLKSIPIPLPPIEIQQKIVDIYSKAHQAKQNKEQEAQQLLDSIDDYLLRELGIKLPIKTSSIDNRCYKRKISFFYGTRYDPYYHQPYFEQAFLAIEKTPFEKNNLGKIATVITSGITPLSGGDAYTSLQKGIPFIRSGDIDIDGDVNFEKLLYLKPEIHNGKMKSSKLQKNDILIAIVGATIGQVGIYKSDREANINQAIALVRLQDGINHEYIKEFIKSPVGQLNLDQLKRPVARANINLEEIASIQVILPSLEKQNEVADNIQNIRMKAKLLQEEANQFLIEAKKEIETIILR